MNIYGGIIVKQHLPFFIGKDAISYFLDFCRKNHYNHFQLVADQNTYNALGNQVESALKSNGFDVRTILLKGKEIIADENYLMKVFLQLDNQERVFLAVGSGTITDITRFTSHRTRNIFISLPTAPSVDGFTSIGAPLVIGGLKQTYICQSPTALFGDISTLINAPKPLIAAGLGDLLGKLLSAADFKLGHILFDEPFDNEIYERTRNTALTCVENLSKIRGGDEDGIKLLMEGLIESGFCMLDFGNSNPASGAEHHISHFWEMKLLREGRPAVLHGAKVGVASIISARWYEQLSNITKKQVKRLLENKIMPDPNKIEAQLKRVFGSISEQIINEQRMFIRMSEEEFFTLKEKVVSNWDLIQDIARQLPPSETIERWLKENNAPITGFDLGLSEKEILLGIKYGHYLRKRFTINKLRLLLNIPDIVK